MKTRNKNHNTIVLPVHVLALLLSLIVGCNSWQKGEADTSDISNKGIYWTSGPGNGSEALVIGENERKIILMAEPPVEMLLASLHDTNKWEVAHVLLTYRYVSTFYVGINEWNGMDLECEHGLDVEMKEIQNYWDDKKKKGELSKPIRVLDYPNEYYDWMFGIERDKPFKPKALKELEEEQGEDLFGETMTTTNPPPRGAEAGGGSESSNP